MSDLELCKKFAELEGKNGDFGASLKGCFVMKYIDGSQSPYNPITDLALNCAAIIKYRLKVEPEYDGEWYATRCDGGWSKRQASKTKDANLQRAVVTCILKSEGLL